MCITEVEVSEQQTDDILLIDLDNRQCEDLFNDMTDEESEEEFDASDDDHCTDLDENENDSERCNLCNKCCFSFSFSHFNVFVSKSCVYIICLKKLIWSLGFKLDKEEEDVKKKR